VINVHEEIAEVQAALDTYSKEFADEIEGLQDLLRLNISDEARANVQALLDKFDRRVQLLQDARMKLGQSQAVLDVMISEGYPEWPEQSVTGMVLQDLVNQKDTITAAIARFTEQAAKLNVTLTEIPRE
jgi:hypothetical protein